MCGHWCVDTAVRRRLSRAPPLSDTPTLTTIGGVACSWRSCPQPSRRRDCHSAAAPPLPLVGVLIETVEGVPANGQYRPCLPPPLNIELALVTFESSHARLYHQDELRH